LDPERLQVLEVAGPMMAPDAIGARVIGVDGFGNVQLNVTREHLVDVGIEGTVGVAGTRVPLVETFTDLPEHGLGVIVDSQGFVALVVNKGSAAEILHLGEGSTVVLE
jgi:S-adenosylmethionine hydrolase